MTMEKFYSNPLRYWKDGSTPVDVSLPHRENGKPFCVRISEESHIPVNALVFADNETDAVGMLVDAFRFAMKNDRSGHSRKEMYKKLLSDPRNISVCPVNPDQAFKVGWADNDDWL